MGITRAWLNRTASSSAVSGTTSSRFPLTLRTSPNAEFRLESQATWTSSKEPTVCPFSSRVRGKTNNVWWLQGHYSGNSHRNVPKTKKTFGANASTQTTAKMEIKSKMEEGDRRRRTRIWQVTTIPNVKAQSHIKSKKTNIPTLPKRMLPLNP